MIGRNKSNSCRGKKEKSLVRVFCFLLILSLNMIWDVFAMELGGFDLEISDDLTDGWWVETDSSANDSADVPASGSQISEKTESSDYPAENQERKINTEDRESSEAAKEKASGNGTANRADSAKEALETDRSGNSGEERNAGAAAILRSTEEKRFSGDRTDNEDEISSIDKNNSGNKIDIEERKASGENRTNGENKTSGRNRTSGENRTSEENRISGEILEKGVSGGQEPELETLAVCYYKYTLDDLYEREEKLLLSSETALFPLSVRLNGKECLWKELETGVLLEADKKTEPVVIEALLLCEAGEPVPAVRCISGLHDVF